MRRQRSVPATLLLLVLSGCYTQLKQAPPEARIEAPPTCESWEPVQFRQNVMELREGEIGAFDDLMIRVDRVRDFRVGRFVPAGWIGSRQLTRLEVRGEADVVLTACTPGEAPHEYGFSTLLRPEEQVVTAGDYFITFLSLDPVRLENEDPIPTDHSRVSLKVTPRHGTQ